MSRFIARSVAAIAGRPDIMDGAEFLSGWTAAMKSAQPPIPRAGPLAQPRSLQQAGLPTDQTRAVIPPDNPQTREKIALGQKLFFCFAHVFIVHTTINRANCRTLRFIVETNTLCTLIRYYIINIV